MTNQELADLHQQLADREGDLEFEYNRANNLEAQLDEAVELLNYYRLWVWDQLQGYDDAPGLRDTRLDSIVEVFARTSLRPDFMQEE
jgi:hypothetical protein